MSTFNKLYERTIARLLADHTAKGVPSDLDLWATIQERLSEQENAAERANESERAGLRVSSAVPPMQPRLSTGGSAIRVWRSASALAGFATFALLALITTLAISGLANRTAKNNPQPSPIIRGREEYTTLFSVTFTPPNILQYVTGFDISEDGTFWIVGQDRHLLHYSANGVFLDSREISAASLVDLEVYGGSIWTLNEMNEVFKIRVDSGLVEIFKPYYQGPGLTGIRTGPNQATTTLRVGGDGQMLIDEGPRYRIVANQDIGKEDQLEPQPLPGYPANGKYYKVDEKSKDLIQAGDVPVTVSISEFLSSSHVFKVMPDGSFYVVAVATNENQCCQPYTARAYIMHYGADGALIEHTRTPNLGQYLALLKQLGVSEDGTFYAAQSELDRTGLPTNRVNILRLNFIPASEPLPPLPTATPAIAQEPDDTTLLFSLPVGEGGIHYSSADEGASPRLGFTASAPDGTFWFSDGGDNLVNFDATGERLRNIPLPHANGDPLGMVIQLQDKSFWLYYRDRGNTTEPANIYHLGPDGSVITNYPVPDYIYNRTNERITDFFLGEHGEVLLRGRYADLVPGSPYFPNPVPTEVMPPTPLKLYWQLADTQGNPTSQALENYTYGGHTYTVRPTYPNGWINRGYIKVDNVEVELVTEHALTAFDLLRVNEDGSFFAGALEDEQVGDPYILTHYTIYHYSVDGRLIERARQPMRGVILPTGHSGDFYTIFEQPRWELRDGKVPDKIEVRRLTFYPADQPLPALPTSIPTAPSHPTVPFPTLTPPAVPPTIPTGVSIEDLLALKAKSDIVAQVRIFGYNSVPGGHLISVEIQRWLWQSTFIDTKNLNLFISDDLWSQMPENFRDDPMTQDRKQQSIYILFLTKGETSPDWGNTYNLVGGPEGAFMVSGDRIADAGIAKYNGWPADTFRDAITNGILTTPTVSVPPQNTPTRVPGADPVSLVRDGEGFRLDVYEGTARFGFGPGVRSSSPWIGPSQLVVEWYSPAGLDQSKSYLLNLANDKVELLSWAAREASTAPRPDGKRVVLMNALTVTLIDMEMGKTETVYDFTPTVSQWAGAEAHAWDLGSLPISVDAEVVWLDQETFVLSLTPRNEKDTIDYASKLLLVNTARREVRLLAARGTLANVHYKDTLLWQSGGVEGGLQMLAPPYMDQPTTITPDSPKGTWIRDWAITPDGKLVAWIEATAPPGDWFYRLPFACSACGRRDPEPKVEAIALWDRATGQISRFPAPNVIWSLATTNVRHTGGLRWRNDGSALLYATHISDKGVAENAGRTALYELAPDGRSTLLAEHNWHGNLEIMWEGNNGSIYYYAMGEKSVAAGDIIRLYPDGNRQVVQGYIGHAHWALDKDGRLEILKEQSVGVRDLTTGAIQVTIFPNGAGEFDTGWSTVDHLVPLSPDGRWAAFAGSNSDLLIVSPDGTPDRGRAVYIVPVKNIPATP
ncbi:MAG TPA: hypothetical protein VJ183_00375 [Chloroflexia bacterium]|nr:hypothetical protein [Chloroflexia bacterium]